MPVWRRGSRVLTRLPALCSVAGMPPAELQAALKESPQRKAASLQILKQLQLVLAGYCGLMDGAPGGVSCSRELSGQGEERQALQVLFYVTASS